MHNSQLFEILFNKMINKRLKTGGRNKKNRLNLFLFGEYIVNISRILFLNLGNVERIIINVGTFSKYIKENSVCTI